MIACLYGPPSSSSSSSDRVRMLPATHRMAAVAGSTTKSTKPQRKTLPDGVELTLSELQEMASRQQQQIESQQQMLVAKEQRVKFLKAQEQRQQELAAENERLRRLRDRVDAQEAKLHKLRSLRGHVDQQKINNSSLTSELESIRSLFNAKEKELSVAVAKVDQLTKQLEELRRGRIIHNGGSGGGGGIGSSINGARTNNYPATIELEKLRQELLYRNKLNEQQQNKLVEQREMVHQRTEEMSRIDRRIAELQQRLHRKRLLNQQLACQINAKQQAQQQQQQQQQQSVPSRPGGGPQTMSTSSKNHGTVPHHDQKQQPLRSMMRNGADINTVSQSGGQFNNVAAVEPYQHRTVPTDEVQRLPHDDLHAKLLNSGGVTAVNNEELLSEFHPNKNDSKYQTLPYNTKFSTMTTSKYVTSGSGVAATTVDNVEANNSVAQVNDNSTTCDKRPDTRAQQQPPTPSPSASQNKPAPGPPVQKQQPQQQPQPGPPPPPPPHKALPAGLSPQTVHSIPTYAPAKAHATPVSQSGGTQPAPTTSTPAPPSSSVTVPTVATVNQAIRQYGSGYTSVANSTTSRVQFAAVDGAGKQLIAPPYIPPPPSTMQKAQQANGGQRSNGPATNMDKPTSAVQPSTAHPVTVKAISNNQSTHFSIAKSTSQSVPPNRPLVTTTNATVVTYQPGSASTTKKVRVPPYPEGANQDANNQLSVSSTSLAAGNHQQVKSCPDSGGGSSEECADLSRPALPPKPPAVPEKPTPPPRQSQVGMAAERCRQDGSTEGIVDSGLGVLHSGTNQQPGNGHRYASKSVIANTYTRKVNNGVLDQYLKSVNQMYGKSGTEPSTENATTITTETTNQTEHVDQFSDQANQTLAQKRPTSSELPIKAKPLTIKKQTGVEPPKLKGTSSSSLPPSTAVGPTRIKGQQQQQYSDVQAQPTRHPQSNNNNSGHIVAGVNRRIEIPPAFLFPPEVVVVGGSGNEAEQYQTDEVDRTNAPIDHQEEITSTDEIPQMVIDVADKRRPLVDCMLDVRLDDNANSGDGDDVPTIEVHSVEDPKSESERPGPIGGSPEAENNNNINKYIETTISSSKGDNDQQTDGVSEAILDNDLKVTGHRLIGNKKGNLKSKNTLTKTSRRVSFDPLALLLDAALEGELELVKKTAREVPNPSAANDEGITALHNAICAGHYEIVQFLVEYGCDVNAQDSDGWTPLHCAASCNNLPMVNFLVEHGACIFATTLSDHETAAEKCEEDEEGFDGCTEYLYSIQEKLGILNGGITYALYDYEAQSSDELSYRDGDILVVLRKGDEFEREWWWSKVRDREGYIPRNLLGLHPRVAPARPAVTMTSTITNTTSNTTTITTISE